MTRNKIRKKGKEKKCKKIRIMEGKNAVEDGGESDMNACSVRV